MKNESSSKKLAELNDASRGLSVTSFARVMYQKVISAEILKFLRETSRGGEITGWKNERVSMRIARIMDTFIISRVAKSAKSKINPLALGDNRRGRDSR